ncbi:hypothetical protein JQK15_20350 [Sphingobium sp. BHU LFT2]|uniref:hypothetical protein n=1 Tax=Sphingobium sp. BHU LFT2 TaxID=2807634 RepID=UPI001BE7AA52|nr:hypothetical protein [Sphingobium sp. BHU LFT2]MBT2245867.1 hypothetical protein [Sphingobium sp. BHU LFT2]
MAMAFKDVGVLSILLCLDLLCLSVAVGNLSIGAGTQRGLMCQDNGAIRILPPNEQTAMLNEMMLHD